MPISHWLILLGPLGLLLLVALGVLLWTSKQFRGRLFDVGAVLLIYVGVSAVGFGGAEWNAHCYTVYAPFYKDTDPERSKAIIAENIRRQEASGHNSLIPFNVALPLTFLGAAVAITGLVLVVRKYG